MFVDDRTPEQRVTHRVLIGGTDRALSGWGLAAGGRSIAIWACKPEDAVIVAVWVQSRTDMTRVRQLSERYRGRKGDHVHIYDVHDTHPALQGDDD